MDEKRKILKGTPVPGAVGIIFTSLTDDEPIICFHGESYEEVLKREGLDPDEMDKAFKDGTGDLFILSNFMDNVPNVKSSVSDKLFAKEIINLRLCSFKAGRTRRDALRRLEENKEDM